MVDAHGGDERELRLRERTVRAGVLLTWAVCAALGVYFLSSWSQPHRALMTALAGVGVLSGVLVELLPTRAIVRSRWREPFFLTWSVLEVGLLLLLLLLEGGTSSPVAALLVVPVVFAGVSYPPRCVIAVGVVTVLGASVVAPLGRDFESGQLLLFATGLALTATMSAWHARNHAEQREQLALLSRTDPLTGALNRRGFEERLDVELVSASRRRRSLAIVLVDLDGFKAVNDTHGHAAGDRLLREVTAALSRDIRAFDAVARLGGDEFAVILADADGQDVGMFVDRLRRAVEERTPGSFGVASFPADGDRRETLLRTGDDRLYEDKRRRDHPRALVS